MGLLTTLLTTLGTSATVANLIGTGVKIAGLASTVYGAHEQSQAINAANEESSKVDLQKLRIAQEQKRRAIRQQIRQAQMLRAQSLATGANQGAQFGSGVQGGMDAITSNKNYNVQGISQNFQRSLYESAANVRQGGYYRSADAASGIQGFGKTLIDNSESIGSFSEYISKGGGLRGLFR